MSEQLPMFGATRDSRLRAAEARVIAAVLDELGESTILRRFLAFHHANPHVFAALERLADDHVRQGTKRLGIKAMVERARWDATLETTAPHGLKVNNSFTAYYARLLAAFRPDLAPCFVTRELGPGVRHVA
jgi:hypothetical protein